MRSFWIILSILFTLAAIIFLFFFFSVKVKNNITFTDDQKLAAPTVTIADPQVGPQDARVTIVNFGDYECSGCVDLETSLLELREEYPNDLKIVWKDMPNSSVHDEALNAAVAARCAGEQNKFWEYHAYLIANSLQLNSEIYLQIATTLELKENAFARCLENQNTLPLVQRSFEEGVALGINATPTIYVNGEKYTGSLTTSELRRVIKAELSGL